MYPTKDTLWLLKKIDLKLQDLWVLDEALGILGFRVITCLRSLGFLGGHFSQAWKFWAVQKTRLAYLGGLHKKIGEWICEWDCVSVFQFWQ